MNENSDLNEKLSESLTRGGGGWCDCQGGWLVRQEKSSKAAEDVFPTDLPETLFNNRTPKYIIRRFKLVIQTR